MLRNIKIFFDFDLFFELLKYFFIPLIVFVTVLCIILKLYCSRKKKNDKEKYVRRSNIISLLFATFITFVLLIVNILFSFNFVNKILINDLVGGNELVYYGVMFSPVIPFLCFIYYLISLIKTMFIDKPHKNTVNEDLSNEKENNEKVKVNEDGIEIL